jgi:hypothetical protein
MSNPPCPPDGWPGETEPSAPLPEVEKRVVATLWQIDELRTTLAAAVERATRAEAALAEALTEVEGAVWRQEKAVERGDALAARLEHTRGRWIDDVNRLRAAEAQVAKVREAASAVGFEWDRKTSQGYPFLADKANVPLLRALFEAIEDDAALGSVGATEGEAGDAPPEAGCGCGRGWPYHGPRPLPRPSPGDVTVAEDGYDPAPWVRVEAASPAAAEPERWPFGISAAADLVAATSWPYEQAEARASWAPRLIHEPDLREVEIARAETRLRSACAALRTTPAEPTRADEGDRS